MFHIHHWVTFRDDGYWLYEHCVRCKRRRLKQRLPMVGQPPNPAWMAGGDLPIPIGEEK